MQNETTSPQMSDEKNEMTNSAEQTAQAASETPQSTEQPVVVQPKKESGFKRFLRFLFGPDTRVGKFMRPFLRIFAMIVVAFAAGMLAAYFILYVPARVQYNESVSVMQQMNTTLQEERTNTTALKGEITALQATMAAQQAENELANFKVYYLIAKNDVTRAKLALVDESNGPGGPTTMAALDDLEKHLSDLLPYVQAQDPVLADLLISRLDVVQSEMARDSEQAKVELENFNNNLLELEAILFE